MSVEETWDAVVIGGGPAGSGVATYLARQGRRVLVLERARFPREHIGESLLPGVLPYLDALGVREKIEQAGFERKIGQTFIWGADRTPWEIDFRELDVHPYAFFVQRARFDQILLDHAASSGATVAQGRAVTRVIFEDKRAVGVVHKGEGGEERAARARFVVDASGQSALVARHAGLRRVVRGLKNTALWAYWEGAGRLPGHRAAHILTTSIPAGWIWVIPLGDRTSVGVVTSGATRAERDRLGAEAWYEQTLRESEPVWQLLAGARRQTPVTGARDWSYRSRRLTGPGILLAGDAACFIDPILSTGVHLAMSSAYWAAACVHSSLREPRHEPFFRSFYEQTYGTMYRELLTQVKAFYRAEGRRDSVYWTSKNILRVDGAVRPDLAFLFITAGLLRNAAAPAPPHDTVAQLRAELGAGKTSAPGATAGLIPEAAPRSRMVSPPLVWRLGARGAAQLVSVRAEGLDLSLAPHEPRGVHDRPRDGYFALDLDDGAGHPLALALVEERRARAVGGTPAGRWSVRLLPYPIRPQDPALLGEIERRLASFVSEGDDPGGPLRVGKVRAHVRRRSKDPDALPAGVRAARAREHRGGGLGEPAMTAVFEATGPGTGVERIYLVVEARLPADLTGLPVLRTRFLDVWVRPERARDGRAIGRIPEAAALIEAACRALWEALLPAGSRPAAFAAAEAALRPPAFGPAGFALVALGRLGAIAEAP